MPTIIRTGMIAIWAIIKTYKWTSILLGTTLGMTFLVPIFAKQEKTNYSKAWVQATSPLGLLTISGVAWVAYLIVKEVREK